MKNEFKMDLHECFKKIISTSISNITNENESLSMKFSSGARVVTSYWRMLEQNGDRISSFDHQQKYGLLETIDAIGNVQKVLMGKSVLNAEFDAKSGDIKLKFSDETILEIFNFSGYEVWEVEFEDGTGQYSNYV